MTSQGALLLADSAGHELSSSLKTILKPYFSVNFLPQTVIKGMAGGLLRQSLGDLIRRVGPSIIFPILPREFALECRPFLESIKKEVAEIPIIAVLEDSEPQRVFELLKVGAADFITSPLTASDVLPRIWRLLKPPDTKPYTECKTENDFSQEHLVGRSPNFLAELKKIPLISKCESNVLIVGETGTGKELYARAIHYGSSRAGRPFVPVNCGAIPVELVENELFGHERGAFTGAQTLQSGLIEEANGGTLFLDEIDCLPLLAQVKLLRFLQEKEYRPLGSPRRRRADVRIIAASNLNLEEAVGNGKLRQDLFYRLNIISLLLPPLRERREDIPLLARHFLAKYSREFDKEMDFAPNVLEQLMIYGWPGNVRELEHVIERAMALCENSVLTCDDLVLPASAGAGRQQSLQQAKAKEIARFEKNYIQALLSASKGNITRAAQAAQKNRRAFWQLIQKHKIDVSRFKSPLSE